MSIPTSFAPLVAVEDDTVVVQNMLDEGMREALVELVEDWTQDDDDEPV